MHYFRLSQSSQTRLATLVRLPNSLNLLRLCSYEKGGQVGELPEAAVLGAVGAVRAERDSFVTGRSLQVRDYRSFGATEYVQDVREAHAAARPVFASKIQDSRTGEVM